MKFYFINFLNNCNIIICIFPILKKKVGAGETVPFKSKFCSCQGLEFASQQLLEDWPPPRTLLPGLASSGTCTHMLSCMCTHAHTHTGTPVHMYTCTHMVMHTHVSIDLKTKLKGKAYLYKVQTIVQFNIRLVLLMFLLPGLSKIPRGSVCRENVSPTHSLPSGTPTTHAWPLPSGTLPCFCLHSHTHVTSFPGLLNS